MNLLSQFVLFADYNQLMNQRQFNAVSRLSREELNRDRGAFFKSVLGSLNHIMVGDIIWLKRFAAHPSGMEPLVYIRQLEKPGSLDSMLFGELDELRREREKIDELIIDWIAGLSETDINGCLSYTNTAGIAFRKPLASLISHLFMHQIHHRGQITTLLSQYNIDFGDTDLVELIADCDD